MASSTSWVTSTMVLWSALLQAQQARPGAGHARSDRPPRRARPSAAPAGRRRGPGPPPPAGAARRRVRRVAAARSSGRGRRGRRARRPGGRSAARSHPSSRGTVAMLSAIVRCGKSPICWITYPMRRRSSCAGTVVTSSPATVIRPDVGSTSRLIIFRVVVLPQPDGPTRTDDLALADVQGEARHGGRRRTGIDLGDPLEADHRRGHGSPSGSGALAFPKEGSE